MLVEKRNPFSIQSPLVLRDLDVLREAARHDLVHVDLSVGTLDETVWRTMEPGTPHPRKRRATRNRRPGRGLRTGA